MNHHLLYVHNGSERQIPAWGANLYARGIVVQPLRSLPEALQYSKVYNVLLIAVELGGADGGVAAGLPEMLEAAGPGHPPVVGVLQTRPGAEDLTRLAQAGLVDVICADEPEYFILWRLDLLRRLGELAKFEQSRTDVGELARKTRTILHDMSQPLSAVQGRLQLLATRCPEEDPNAQIYQDLVRMAFDVTHQLMMMQQLHRQFS